MTTNTEYCVKQITEKLIGATIIGATISEDNESFGFIVKTNNKTSTVWVDCDAEGNGAGWLAYD